MILTSSGLVSQLDSVCTLELAGAKPLTTSDCNTQACPDCMRLSFFDPIMIAYYCVLLSINDHILLCTSSTQLTLTGTKAAEIQYGTQMVGCLYACLRCSLQGAQEGHTLRNVSTRARKTLPTSQLRVWTPDCGQHPHHPVLLVGYLGW